MIKKYMIAIFVLLLVILLGIINEDKFLIREKIILNTNTLPKKINYKIPLLKQKIHIDILTTDKICEDYIKRKYIEIEILHNGKTINIDEINELSLNEIININILSKSASNNCKIILYITDPYGNMWKTLITIILPIILIFYIILKLSWNLLMNTGNKMG